MQTTDLVRHPNKVYELLERLDKIGRDADSSEYSLPMYDDGRMALMREAVYQWALDPVPPSRPDYWTGEDPEHTVLMWKHEVAIDRTRRGYWEWVAAMHAGTEGDGARRSTESPSNAAAADVAALRAGGYAYDAQAAVWVRREDGGAGCLAILGDGADANGCWDLSIAEESGRVLERQRDRTLQVLIDRAREVMP